MADIFLSYSREDKAFKEAIFSELRQHGFSVWVDDVLEPGTLSWYRVVESEIENAGCLLVLLSPTAKKSDWVAREIDHARTHDKTVFPIIIEGDKKSSIPLLLQGTQFVDLRSTHYSEGFPKLLNALNKRLSEPDVPIKAERPETPKRIGTETTWKDVVVATMAVAHRHNEPAPQWFRWAGISEETNDTSVWDDPYDGKPVDEWEVPTVIRVEINSELAKMQGLEPSSKRLKAVTVRASGELIKLDVPYVSLLGADARSRLANCGPIYLAMLINAEPVLKRRRTVDELYELYLKKEGKQDYRSWAQLKYICSQEDLDPKLKNNDSQSEALHDLRTLIRAGRTFVALVKYSFWKEAASANGYGGAHYVLVTGIDDEHVYVHDALFPPAKPNPGEFYPLTIDTFMKGWGGFASSENPNYSRLATQKVVSRLSG